MAPDAGIVTAAWLSVTHVAEMKTEPNRFSRNVPLPVLLRDTPNLVCSPVRLSILTSCHLGIQNASSPFGWKFFGLVSFCFFAS